MSRAKRVTVLLADDHVVVRQGLRVLLKSEGTFDVVGEAQTGREAVALSATLRPDVIVMDIAMPVLNGLEATRQILAANPAAKILILSAHSDDKHVERVTEVGALGFLEKETSTQILTKAIYEIAKGKSFFSPAIARRMADSKSRSLDRDGLPELGRARLSSRQMEVLQLVAEGKANKEVAAELGISIKTVEKPQHP